MIAILTENFAGKWPFWMSPRQIAVIPVAPKYDDYAEKVTSKVCFIYAQIRQKCHEAGFFVDVDLSSETLPKKIRNAEISHYNFTFGNLILNSLNQQTNTDM
jgi:threonyl-tRNA synthetase